MASFFLLRSSFFSTTRPLASSDATAYYRPAPGRTDGIPERDQRPRDNGYKSVFTISWLVRRRNMSWIKGVNSFIADSAFSVHNLLRAPFTGMWCDKSKESWKMGSGPEYPFGLEDKASTEHPACLILGDLQTLHIPTKFGHNTGYFFLSLVATSRLPRTFQGKGRFVKHPEIKKYVLLPYWLRLYYNYYNHQGRVFAGHGRYF